MNIDWLGFNSSVPFYGQRENRGLTPIIFSIIFLLFLSISLSSYASDKDNVFQSNNLFVEYKTEPVRNSDSGEVLYNNGRISIRNKSNKIIYEEFTSLQPAMCDDYPIISTLTLPVSQENMLGGGRDMVVLCGSISGRHKTIKLFLEGPNGLRTTSIDYENTRPNLEKVDNKDIYVSNVYRRVLFKDVGYQTASYLYVYTLHVDSSIFGFKLAYGKDFKDQYMDYYNFIIKNINSENINNYIGPLLAALISTQEEVNICNGIGRLRQKGLEIKNVDDWRVRLASAGYPDFDFNICQGI